MLFLFGCGGSGGTDPDANICKMFRTSGSNRIIAGESCTASYVPVVKLTVFDEEDNPTVCSGVVVDSRKVLTAAHCFENFAQYATVEVRGVAKEVKNWTLHPDLSQSEDQLLYDVALLELKEDISPPFAQLLSSSELSVGESIYIYGFGQTSADVSSYGVLHGGKMTLSKVEELLFFADYSGQGSNTCHGDSGGPAFVLREGKLMLAGLTESGTQENCQIGDRAVFTNLGSSRSRSWLESLSVLPPR